MYRKIGNCYVVVASMGGAPTNPNWYSNPVEQPDCEIQVARDVVAVRARTVHGAERERLWAEMVELLPQYAEYQARTERLIPVVVLEPRA